MTDIPFMPRHFIVSAEDKFTYLTKLQRLKVTQYKFFLFTFHQNSFLWRLVSAIELPFEHMHIQ